MRVQIASQQQKSINEALAGALEEVESRFAAELFSDLQCVNSLAGHIEQYRGKMFRPRLVLVASMAIPNDGGQPSRAQRVLATVVEMVHMATLVHDDILDDATVRRRGSTLNHMEGNETAVMLGDYLISHAYHLCSSLGKQHVSRAIADTTNTVCEGELLQLANRNNWELDEPTYFEIIRRKTASLCGTCCRLSATLADCSSDVGDHLYGYGEKVGVAYQIVDDLLDLVGQENTVGKTLGRDLDKGKLTLPLIHHLNTIDGSDRERLLTLLQNQSTPFDPQQVDQIRQLIADSGAIAYSQEWAARLIDQAKSELDGLCDSESKTLLMTMADRILTRCA